MTDMLLSVDEVYMMLWLMVDEGCVLLLPYAATAFLLSHVFFAAVGVCGIFSAGGRVVYGLAH